MQRFSPYAALREHAQRQPDADAIVRETLRVSYVELLERVTAAASWLLYRGFTPGEVTGLCIRDEIAHLVCATAILCLGTPQTSLGSHENSGTKQALARKLRVKQLIVEEPAEWMQGLRTIVLPRGDRKPILSSREIIPSRAFHAYPLDSIFVYQSTSGSTSTPKTFGLTFERLRILSERYANDPKERRALRVGSIEFDAHRMHRICSLMAGNSCIFLRDLNLRNPVAVCKHAEVSTIHMGTYKLASLISEETDRSAQGFHRSRRFRLGAQGCRVACEKNSNSR